MQVISIEVELTGGLSPVAVGVSRGLGAFAGAGGAGEKPILSRTHLPVSVPRGEALTSDRVGPAGFQ